MESFEEFNPQYPVSLVKQVTEFLTNAIIAGRLPEGHRLSENELQHKFGISRGPIRESFRILERNGLVTTLPRKGTFVRKIEKKDIDEIFPILAVLEGLAARLAASHLNHGDIERMKLSLSRMAEAAEKNDFKSYVDYHSEYHKIFLYASENSRLILILENLRHQIVWTTSKYLSFDNSFEYSLRVHGEIIDLFTKKDVDRLEALVSEHIVLSFQKLLHYLASRS